MDARQRQPRPKFGNGEKMEESNNSDSHRKGLSLDEPQYQDLPPHRTQPRVNGSKEHARMGWRDHNLHSLGRMNGEPAGGIYMGGLPTRLRSRTARKEERGTEKPPERNSASLIRTSFRPSLRGRRKSRVNQRNSAGIFPPGPIGSSALSGSSRESYLLPSEEGEAAKPERMLTDNTFPRGEMEKPLAPGRGRQRDRRAEDPPYADPRKNEQGGAM